MYETSMETYHRILKQNMDCTPDKTITFGNLSASLDKTIDASLLDECSCGRSSPLPSVPCTKCLAFYHLGCTGIEVSCFLQSYILAPFYFDDSLLRMDLLWTLFVLNASWETQVRRRAACWTYFTGRFPVASRFRRRRATGSGTWPILIMRVL